jgi:hypothetical protein
MIDLCARVFCLRWSSLSGLGDNRIIRSSYFWFVFVPIVARITQQINEPLQKAFFGLSHTAVWIQLPFSWFMFFFAALFFSIATFLYSISCPEIIRRYPTPIAYYQAGNGILKLIDFFNRLPYEAQKNVFRMLSSEVTKALGAFELETVVEPNEEDLEKLRERMWRVEREQMNEIFALLYNRFDVSQHWMRCIITVFYYTGFALALCVAWQSIHFVWSMWCARPGA